MQGPTISAPREASKLITCILPDDGSHRTLLEALYQEKQITRADTTSCLLMGSLADARVKPGMLPDVSMARIVTVIVPAADADDLFEFIYETAHVGRDGGGIVLQNALAAATPFALPEGVAEEKTSSQSES